MEFIVLGIQDRKKCDYLWIEGKSFTGKTVIVDYCIDYLNNEVENNNIKKFNFLKINASNLISKDLIYSELFYFLFTSNCREEINTKLHFNSLDLYFKTGVICRNYEGNFSKDEPLVVVLDHFNSLPIADQLDMQHFFDWSKSKECNFILIGISNYLPSINFANKIIKPQNIDTDLFFKNYIKEDQVNIFKKTMKEKEIFSNDSLDFISKMICGLSDDLKGAFSFCEDIQTLYNKELILKDKKIALNECKKLHRSIFDNQSTFTLKKLEKIEIEILFTIMNLTFKVNHPSVECNKVYNSYLEIYSFFNFNFQNKKQIEDKIPLSIDRFEFYIKNLFQLSLLNLSDEVNFQNKLILPMFLSENLIYVMKKDFKFLNSLLSLDDYNFKIY